jgi:hypothetical protein
MMHSFVNGEQILQVQTFRVVTLNSLIMQKDCILVVDSGFWVVYTPDCSFSYEWENFE